MTTNPTDGPIHTWFGLSYCNYQVLHRTLMQSMPIEWQERMVACLEELREAFEHVEQPECFEVKAATEHIVNEMTEAELSEAGIETDWYDEPVPEDYGPFDLAEWRAEHEKDAPTYHDRDGNEVDPHSRVLLPAVDPVPHYNRGRTYIEPRPAGPDPCSGCRYATCATGSRTLTETEHNRAWHAVEGAAGEEGADPGTVLNAVLRALGINPPAEETHVVADDSDDPERIDGMRRRAAAAVPAVPTTTKDGDTPVVPAVRTVRATPDDAHVQHTWTLARADDEISIDLWTDGYTVRIDGGPDDGDQREGGRADVDHLLTRYLSNGYRLVRDYPVNDPADPDAEDAADGEPDGKPDACPECGSPVEYEASYSRDWREGPAWLCTGCQWGQWLTA